MNETHDTGKLIIICAPSGAGKTTIVKYLLSRNLSLQFSISATTRSIRSNEVDGRDYYFLDKEVFLHKIASKEFVEFEEVYPGSFYGTLRSELTRIWKTGNHIIFDLDVQGALHLQRKYPENSLSIFIAPPSIDVLEQRLILRGTNTEQDLKTRLEKAKFELNFSHNFDFIVVNGQLELACAEVEQQVLNFLAKIKK